MTRDGARINFKKRAPIDNFLSAAPMNKIEMQNRPFRFSHLEYTIFGTTVSRDVCIGADGFLP
jgi:hypothetical protein